MIIENRPPVIAPTGLGIALPLNYTFSDIASSGLVEISLVIDNTVAVEWRLRPIVQSGLAIVDVSEPIRQYLSGRAKVRENVENMEISCEYWLEGDSANKRVAVYAAMLPTVSPQSIAASLPAPVALAASAINSFSFRANREVASALFARVDLFVTDASGNILQTIEDVGLQTIVAVPSSETEYRYFFRGVFLGALGTASNIIALQTTEFLPPIAVPATMIEATSFQANWINRPDVTDSRIDVSTVVDFSSFVVENQLVQNDDFFLVTGLSINTTYYYRVRNLSPNGVETSPNSNVIETQTFLAVPNAPVAIAASSILTDRFVANWEAVSNATSYRLDVSTQSNFSSFVSGFNNKTVSGISDTVTGLANNTQYYYRVRAVNSAGTSGNSNTISLFTIIAAPTLLAEDNITTTSFRANWNAVAGAVSYNYDVATDSAFANIIIANQSTTATNFTASGLSLNTQYWYRVRTVGANNTSLYSIGNVTTANAVFTITPQVVNAGGSGTKTASLVSSGNWSAGTVTIAGREAGNVANFFLPRSGTGNQSLTITSANFADTRGAGATMAYVDYTQTTPNNQVRRVVASANGLTIHTDVFPISIASFSTVSGGKQMSRKMRSMSLWTITDNPSGAIVTPSSGTGVDIDQTFTIFYNDADVPTSPTYIDFTNEVDTFRLIIDL